MSEPKNINETLDEREITYGNFYSQATISQKLKLVLQQNDEWKNLFNDEREALDMIVHKIGRILNGGLRDSDNWHDIAGYATLVERKMVKSND